MLGDPWGPLVAPFGVLVASVPEALRGCSGCLLGSLGLRVWPLLSHWGANENVEKPLFFILNICWGIGDPYGAFWGCFWGPWKAFGVLESPWARL